MALFSNVYDDKVALQTEWSKSSEIDNFVSGTLKTLKCILWTSWLIILKFYNVMGTTTVGKYAKFGVSGITGS